MSFGKERGREYIQKRKVESSGVEILRQPRSAPETMVFFSFISELLLSARVRGIEATPQWGVVGNANSRGCALYRRNEEFPGHANPRGVARLKSFWGLAQVAVQISLLCARGGSCAHRQRSTEYTRVIEAYCLHTKCLLRTLYGRSTE
jgi:hypothetical protein